MATVTLLVESWMIETLLRSGNPVSLFHTFDITTVARQLMLIFIFSSLIISYSFQSCSPDKDRSGSADPIRSTSKIEADRSYLIFIIDLLRFLSCSVVVLWQMFRCFTLLKLYHITALIFSLCFGVPKLETNFINYIKEHRI